MIEPPVWHVGQKAVINRSAIVTVERVIPTGRVIIGNQIFNSDGYERKGSRWFRDKLEPLTEEISADMALAKRAKVATENLDKVVDAVIRWTHRFRPRATNRHTSTAEVEEIETAERLAEAISQIIPIPKTVRGPSD